MVANLISDESVINFLPNDTYNFVDVANLELWKSSSLR